MRLSDTKAAACCKNDTFKMSFVTNSSVFSLLFKPNVLHAVDKGGRITDLCALMIISVPINIPIITSAFTPSHVSEYVLHLFICFTHFAEVLVTPNFSFPNYACNSCLSVEKESR